MPREMRTDSSAPHRKLACKGDISVSKEHDNALVRTAYTAPVTPSGTLPTPGRLAYRYVAGVPNCQICSHLDGATTKILHVYRW